MAKKKVEKEAAVAVSDGDFCDKDIQRLYGDILFSGKHVFSQDRKVIPISPAIDLEIGGGIAESSIVILSGQPGCGKSSLALKMAYNCHLPKYGTVDCPEGRRIFFLSSESRLQDRDFSCYNFDYSRFTVIKSTKEKILNAQEQLSIVETLLKKYPGCIMIVDSFSALCTEEEFTKGMGDMLRADGAKLLSKFFRKVRNVVTVNENILIGIVHLMGNPTPGQEFKEKGGLALVYNSDYRLRCKYHQFVTVGKDDDSEKIGQKVFWNVLRSPLNKPGGEFTSFLRYGYGIDEASELAQLGIDLAVIQKSGTWFSLADFGVEKQLQGFEKLAAELKTNQEAFNKLKVAVYDLMGHKYEPV